VHVPAGASLPASRVPQIALGRAEYDRHCTSCHGLGGHGTSQGPPLLGAGAAAVDFYLSTGRMPLAVAGQQPMRQAPVFSRGQIDALVAYVTSLYPDGPPVPRANPAAGDLVRGGRLFTENCAPCHGAAAAGDAVGAGAVAPSLWASTPTEIEEAVRVGPGVMPRFGPDELSQRDLDSIARYLLSLRTRPSPGGLSLGYTGPVAEGFVAWIAGLGLIVLAIRWIGTAA
jgi:ubiquinol-cytochrome c reductase cytochrome c subunit